MGGVFQWFEERGEIPLLTPYRVREYGPLTDAPERAVDDAFVDTIDGVAFAMEYCDAHGWMSTRTVRCLAINPKHPACIRAFCSVRREVTTLRVDRIISIIELRTARILQGGEYLALLAPYLTQAEPGANVRAVRALQQVTRDGVFALLHVAMRDGKLSDEARDLVLSYISAEAYACICSEPPTELVELWVDNLAPSLDGVLAAVARLLEDREKIARLLPYLLKVARCNDPSISIEISLRDLMAAVRTHFRDHPRGFPSDLRATR
jgi:hypothetical protein